MPAPAAADRSVEPATTAGESFDWSGLTDVERLAFGDATVVVDQTDEIGGVPPCQCVRDEAAQLSGSNDGDLAHAVRYCNTHAITQGKVAVVTGGSRGIGFAIAQALAAEGARLRSPASTSRTWPRRG